MTPEEALTAVAHELAKAQHAFGPFASAHEGKAVIEEELEELWLEIKNDKQPSDERVEKMRHEAMQTAAMALRFMVDLT